jgi:hypothetical protein
MERPKKIPFIFGALILLSAVLAVPVAAKIVTSTEAIFDADGTTEEFGEEILVRITIKPGDAEIRDLQIDVSERDALIDDTTFKHTIIPTGAPVNVERNGHTFQCDRLATGESIVLSFNAYPKTLGQDKLTVTDVTYSYVQQGDTISGKDTITVDTSGSLWFQYLTARENATVSWTLYAGIFLIVLAIALSGYQLSWKKKLQSAADSDRRKVYALLEEVSQKLDLVQDNPSVRDGLKKRIDRELKSQEPVETPKSSIRESKPNSGPKKKSRFN